MRGDAEEINIHGTDPLDSDSDGDGLADGEEVDGDPATNPADRDSDDDGGAPIMLYPYVSFW